MQIQESQMIIIFTQRVKIATHQIARTGARITALQLLAIAGYSASTANLR